MDVAVHCAPGELADITIPTGGELQGSVGHRLLQGPHQRLIVDVADVHRFQESGLGFLFAAGLAVVAPDGWLAGHRVDSAAQVLKLDRS